MRSAFSILIALIIFSGCGTKQVKQAPLLLGLGNLNHPVTTTSELAQKYFNQGLTLAYGFNHEEAFRSFKEAARLDTNCAMAYWGMAYVLGPNINLPMDTSAEAPAYNYIQKAIALLDNETQEERDLVEAMSKRYSKEVMKDRTPLDQAYCDAMREVSKKYSDDPDAAAIFAESIMDLHPWDYWNKDGTPQPWTPELLSVLESVIKRNPDHIGANHFYIHSVEASKNPWKGLASANRLRFLVPGAGHLVHMPAHIYIRTGQYHEGTLANMRAVKSDEEYISQCRQQGFYPLSYYPHNYHFMCATAALEGDSKTAIMAALKTAEIPPDSLMDMCGYKTLQHFASIPLYTYVIFGKWKEILNYPEPQDARPYMLAVWHYARGMAYLGTNDLKDAETEIKNLEKIRFDKNLNDLTIWGINSAGSLIQIAYEVTKGEFEAKKKNYSEAISHLKKAVEIEDGLRYDEPPTWLSPCRQNFGAVLFEAGRYAEAEKVYRENLAEYPQNGWGLFGLHQALVKENKIKEAVEVENRFKEAWKYSDINLTSSRIL
jgi:tetratricopeptide (TPR) repeat protein